MTTHFGLQQGDDNVGPKERGCTFHQRSLIWRLQFTMGDRCPCTELMLGCVDALKESHRDFTCYQIRRETRLGKRNHPPKPNIRNGSKCSINTRIESENIVLPGFWTGIVFSLGVLWYVRCLRFVDDPEQEIKAKPSA